MWRCNSTFDRANIRDLSYRWVYSRIASIMVSWHLRRLFEKEKGTKKGGRDPPFWFWVEIRVTRARKIVLRVQRGFLLEDVGGRLTSYASHRTRILLVAYTPLNDAFSGHESHAIHTRGTDHLRSRAPPRARRYFPWMKNANRLIESLITVLDWLPVCYFPLQDSSWCRWALLNGSPFWASL